MRTDDSKCSAVLTFERPDSARTAASEMDGRTADGIRLSVSAARRNNSSWCSSPNKQPDFANRGRSVHLFFRGYLKSEDVEEFFQGVGRVTRIYLNVQKRFGFVTFENKEQAHRAIKELSGEFCRGVKIVVSPQKFLCPDATDTEPRQSDTGDRELIAYEDIGVY